MTVPKHALDRTSPTIDGRFESMAGQAKTTRLYPFNPYISQASDVPEYGLEGVCPVCGEHSVFRGFSLNLRETGHCSSCASTNRQRQMAYAIRKIMLMAPKGRFVFPNEFSIFNAESTGPLHQRLSSISGYISSEYFGDGYRRGEEVDGIRHEDLQNLSFADRSLDLILSSDVLEHMPAPYRAHREIFRVLKPGGRHIFTVPFNPGESKDDVRATIVDGKIVHLAEKLFHGDPVRPDEGILVWTIFGTEMMKRLEDIGFDASAWNFYEPDSGIIGAGAIVFDAYKPLERRGALTDA